MKRGKKALAVLSTAALFGTTPAAVALPFLTSSVAYAAGSATALVVPNISSSASQADLGTIDLYLPKGALASGQDNQVTVILPSGFQFSESAGTTGSFDVTTDGTVTYKLNNQVKATNNNWTLLTANDAKNDGLSAYVDAQSGSPSQDSIHVDWSVASGTLLKLIVSGAQSDDWNIYVHLGNIKLTGPAGGPANVTLVAPSNSALPTGTVTVGNVASGGRVDLSATDVQSGSDTLHFNLSLSEEVAGSLRTGTAVKLKLPSGFKWKTTSSVTYDPEKDATAPVPTDTKAVITHVYGPYAHDVGLQVTSNGDDTLTVTINNPTDKLVDSNGTPAQGNTYGSSNGAGGYLIQGLTFYVDDETIAKSGDVSVLVSGSSSVNTSNLVVGHYGQIGFQVTSEGTPTLISGKKEQTIGDIFVKETVPGSFVADRTVTLTLPDGARWEQPFEDSTKTDTAVGSINTTNGLAYDTISYTDTDRRTLKIHISQGTNANSTNPGELDLRNFQVALQPGFSGDLTIQVGGTEGATGSVTVATVEQPVSINVDNPPNVIIGSGGQSIGDITLTENVAGGFGKTTANGKTYNRVHLELPYGVQFDGTPDVSVTQGDLVIKDVTSGLGPDNKGYLDFYVDSESTTPSVVTIKNAKLKLDRTVPEGDILLKVKGESVSYTAYALDGSDPVSGNYAVPIWNANNTTAASAVVAKVTTPAQSGSNVATFTVGSTTYTVNGQQQTMDVAPYLKNDGRVMLPVRFVANALGVSDDSIIWNQNDKSVTIFKGGSVVKMTLGSNTLIVNGTAVQMDVAPELYNDGRVMLPIRWVGQALNANISWDQATQTVTVTTQQ